MLGELYFADREGFKTSLNEIVDLTSWLFYCFSLIVGDCLLQYHGD